MVDTRKSLVTVDPSRMFDNDVGSNGRAIASAALQVLVVVGVSDMLEYSVVIMGNLYIVYSK